MSTTVCQPVQPQFSPWFDLFEPRAMWFNLSVSSQLDHADDSLAKPQQCKENTHNVPNHVEVDKKKNTTNNNESVKGWSFLQGETTQKGNNENDHVFVHPLTKNSASKLSEKSLEMCTESLGSESGSGNGDDLMISLGSEIHTRSKMPGFEMTKRSGGCGYNFPPPLTTISGGGCGGGGVVRVEHLREDGRLVIKATNVETPQCCFKAERSGGRLRLHFVSCDNREYYDDDNDNDNDNYDNNDGCDDDNDGEFDCGDEGDEIC